MKAGVNMSAGIWFWIIYVVIGVFGFYLGYTSPATDRRMGGALLLIFILVGLVGWGVFGPPIR